MGNSNKNSYKVESLILEYKENERYNSKMIDEFAEMVAYSKVHDKKEITKNEFMINIIISFLFYGCVFLYLVKCHRR